MISDKIIENFCSGLTIDYIYTYTLKHLINHSYFSSSTIAKKIFFQEFRKSKCVGEFDKYIRSITGRVSHVVRKLKEEGIVEKFNGQVYRVIRKNGNDNNDVIKFTSIVKGRGMGKDYLCLYVLAKTTEQYNLIKDKTAEISIKLFN